MSTDCPTGDPHTWVSCEGELDGTYAWLRGVWYCDSCGARPLEQESERDPQMSAEPRSLSGVMTWEGLTPPYATIVADPPWRYQSAAATKANASKQYSTMSMDEIGALPVADLAASDTHLWLWCTNALMEDGFRIVRAWGFSPLTMVTWCKPGPGVGHYLRNNTEHCILASRGKPQVPADKPLSTWYVWPRGAHSAKPAAFGDLVEQVSQPPYVELFCRRPRFGWDSWGKGYELGASA